MAMYGLCVCAYASVSMSAFPQLDLTGFRSPSRQWNEQGFKPLCGKRVEKFYHIIRGFWQLNHKQFGEQLMGDG